MGFFGKKKETNVLIIFGESISKYIKQTTIQTKSEKSWSDKFLDLFNGKYKYLK